MSKELIKVGFPIDKRRCLTNNPITLEEVIEELEKLGELDIDTVEKKRVATLRKKGGDWLYLTDRIGIEQGDNQLEAVSNLYIKLYGINKKTKYSIKKS